MKREIRFQGIHAWEMQSTFIPLCTSSNTAAFLWRFIRSVLIKQLLYITLDTREAVGTQRLMKPSPYPQGTAALTDQQEKMKHV